MGNMPCHCIGSWAACTSPRRIHVAICPTPCWRQPHMFACSSPRPAGHARHSCGRRSPSLADSRFVNHRIASGSLCGGVCMCPCSASSSVVTYRMMIWFSRAHPGAIDIGIGWSPPQVSMVHTLGKDASLRVSFSASAWHRYGHVLFAGKCMRRAPKSALPRIGGVVARAVALAHVALCTWVETQVGPKLLLRFNSYGRVVLPTRSDSRMWMRCGVLSVIEVSPSSSLLVVRTFCADSCRHLGGQASAPELGLRPSQSGRLAPLSGVRR